MNNLRENKPTADILMMSMRAMGYSFESAVADIVDNSISAEAKRISIRFAICDDGHGMSSEELFDAMKYGSEQKRTGRSESDLGRFGLGLKSASLSQCRKLTVASKKDGHISAYYQGFSGIRILCTIFRPGAVENQLSKSENLCRSG